jgi:hypothetical protein
MCRIPGQPSHQDAGARRERPALTRLRGYPPFALYLFAPFTLLPLVLWWGLPLAITAWAVWRLHPAPLVWPLMALCLSYPTSGLKILTGNPTMWVLAAIALGVLYGWPFVGVLIKPSLFPFALLGVRHRSWWVALLVLGLAGLPFALLWRDWAVALVNAQGSGLLYSVQEVPLLCLPLPACVGRAKAPRPSDESLAAVGARHEAEAATTSTE